MKNELKTTTALPETRSFLISFSETRTTLVELDVNPYCKEFKFRFFMPGCGCGESYIAAMDYPFAATDWELIKDDIKTFVRNSILEINGLKIHFCKQCGAMLPPVGELYE